MSPSMKNAQPATRSADGVEEKVAQIAVMTIAELRLVWRQTFASEPSSAFSKDLLARAIAYRIQEEAYGGHCHVVERCARPVSLITMLTP